MTSAVTFIDSPGQLANTSEPMNFTCTRAVLSVSVRFTASGKAELAYYVDNDGDGHFTTGYSLSTATSGGTVFELVRSSRWPAAFELLVEPGPEPTVAPTAGQGWSSIYAVDMTAQASQTMTTAGSYTIDGKTWWSKGSLAFNGTGGVQQNALINGSGLAAASCAFGATGSFTHQCLWMPFAQLADYNPAAPVAVVVRWAGTGVTSTTYLVFGIASMADSSAYWQSAERNNQILGRYYGDAVNFFSYTDGDALGFHPAALVSASATLGNNVFSVGMPAKRIGHTGHAAYAGSMPTDIYSFASGLSGRRMTSVMSNPGFVLTRNQNCAAYLTHLSILQPKVP